MKKQILTVVMIAASFISLTQVEVTNKYLFSYGTSHILVKECFTLTILIQIIMIYI